MTSSTITKKSKSWRATTWKSRCPCRSALTTAVIYFCRDAWLTDVFTYLFLLRLLQHQEQVLTDTVDGREIYNTIRRKPKDAFYKNIVKKGYLLFNKGEICCVQLCERRLRGARQVGIYIKPGLSRHQAKASGGRTSTSSWREPTPSSSTLRAKREQPNPKGWSIWACALCMVCMTVCLAGELWDPLKVTLVLHWVALHWSQSKVWSLNPVVLFLVCSRPNCFQVVVQHFSEEQYIFYFAGEAPELAQVIMVQKLYKHVHICVRLLCSEGQSCLHPKKWPAIKYKTTSKPVGLAQTMHLCLSKKIYFFYLVNSQLMTVLKNIFFIFLFFAGLDEMPPNILQ